jgi:hypothetical protein
MTPDVAQLELTAFDPIDFDQYEDGGTGSYAPPPEGKYIARAPQITDESFGVTKAGYLKVTLDPIEVLSPEANGYKIRFTKLSAKKYAKRNGSQTGDFLRACGIAFSPKNNDELKQALKMASLRTFSFVLIWEAFNKDLQESTSGYENFPPDPQDPTQRLPYILDPHDPTKRWWAYGKVRYFVSAIPK